MSKPKNQYTFIVTKRYRDNSFVIDDKVFEVKVKADSIEEAERKANIAGEVKTAYNPDRYIYRVELLEVSEI
jgi:hypothetical protein